MSIDAPALESHPGLGSGRDRQTSEVGRWTRGGLGSLRGAHASLACLPRGPTEGGPTEGRRPLPTRPTDVGRKPHPFLVLDESHRVACAENR